MNQVDQKGCAYFFGAMGTIIAIITLLFGDNIYERITGESISNLFNSWNLTNPQVEVDGVSWAVSIDEAGNYRTKVLSEEDIRDFAVDGYVIFEDSIREFHGLMFRKQDSESFYTFRITPGGEYSFDIWRPTTNGSIHESLLGPTASMAINTGPGRENYIKVIGSGSKFEFYINGEKVGTYTDKTYPSGKVGLFSCTCEGSSAADVSFRDVSLTSKP